MSVWKDKIGKLTPSELRHALSLTDMELRGLMGLKGSPECQKVRIVMGRRLGIEEQCAQKSS